MRVLPETGREFTSTLQVWTKEQQHVFENFLNKSGISAPPHVREPENRDPHQDSLAPNRDGVKILASRGLLLR